MIDRHPAEIELLFVTRRMTRDEYRLFWGAERAYMRSGVRVGIPVIFHREGLNTFWRHLHDADQHNRDTRWRAEHCPEALYRPVSEAYRYHIDMREADVGASQYERDLEDAAQRYHAGMWG